MDKINFLLKKDSKYPKKSNNVNNVIKENSSIVNNVINGEVKNKKYELDPSKFTPNTPKTQLANDIAIYFDDLLNFAFYLHVVNKLGYERADAFWRNVKDEIEEKKKNADRQPIRSPKRYFAWRFKNKLY
jgi:hypothetical protein